MDHALSKDSQNRYLLGDPGQDMSPSLFGTRVVVTNAVTADTILVASLAQAATFYNREGTIIDLSESDSDNFTKTWLRSVQNAVVCLQLNVLLQFVTVI